MANRFWTGGTGSWDASTTTNWSATSGGAGGASVPTSADNVTLDTASNATSYTVTLTATANCANLTISAPASGNVTVAGTSIQLNVYGNFTLYSGMTWGAISVYFVATGAATVTTAGKTISVQEWNGVGGSWTNQDAFVSDSGPALRAGTLNTNGFAFTCVGFNSANTTSARTLTLGSSLFTCNSWTVASTNLTFNPNTSTIVVNGTIAFTSAGLTYNRVDFTGTGLATTISGANTFATLNRTNTSGYVGLLLGANQTVTGTFTCTGNNASTQRIYIASDTVGTPRTITAAVVSLTNVDFEDITGAGAATWSGTLVGDCGGNTGITFASPLTCYWVHDGTASHPITDTRWMTASGGAVATRFPLPHDTALFDASSFGATGKTVTIGTSALRLPSLNWSAATNAPTFTTEAITNIYGSIIFNSAVLRPGTNQLNLKGRGTHSITSGGVTWLNSNVTLTGAGTYTLTDAFTGANVGVTLASTLNTGGFAVTSRYMNMGGGSYSVLNMGATVWTVAGPGVLWSNAGGILNAGTSTFIFNDASSTTKTCFGGGSTFNNIWLTGAGTGTFDFIGNNTFNDFKVDTPPHTVRFTAGSITTIATLTVSGTVGNLMTLSGVTAANWSIVKTGGVVERAYLSVTNSQASPPGWFAATSTNGGSNTGWVFASKTMSVGARSNNINIISEGSFAGTM